MPKLYFYDTAVACSLLGVDSGRTLSPDYFSDLTRWTNLACANPADSCLVYAGHEVQKRTEGRLFGWDHLELRELL